MPGPTSAHKAPAIFIVSDGRGTTGTQLVKAALVQFEGQDYQLHVRTRVRTARQVRTIVKEAVAASASIFYTLVSEKTRKVIAEESMRSIVPCVDLLGSSFSALHDLFKRERGSTPGLLYDSDREHFDRIDAIDYTLKHDDGHRAHELDAADVVLVGVSRASKSSTCFYLAYEGIRSANVPLFPDIDPPNQLLELDPGKVIGLTINALRLRTVREARARGMSMGVMDDYLDTWKITREIRFANRLMARQKWHRVDVSYRAIEEVAREVIDLRGFRSRNLR